MRIVSLVPNATEILFALGAGDEVVGVSHECDYPPEARTRPILTGSALTPGMAPKEVDAAVSAQLASGASLYTLDEKRLAELEPDLLFTQELCPVCAVSTAQVGDGGRAPCPGAPRSSRSTRRASRTSWRTSSMSANASAAALAPGPWSTACAPGSTRSNGRPGAGSTRPSSPSSGSTRRSSAATGCPR